MGYHAGHGPPRRMMAALSRRLVGIGSATSCFDYSWSERRNLWRKNTKI